MIARVWRCTAAGDKAAHYIEHFNHGVLPELRQIDGYKGAYLLRRELDDGVEITVMTLWESMDTIRKFAGENVETAVVAPAAQAVLRSFDKTVTHHEIVMSPEQAMRR
jgi:heme-degrading monooxygenase HmoA